MNIDDDHWITFHVKTRKADQVFILDWQFRALKTAVKCKACIIPIKQMQMGQGKISNIRKKQKH